MGAIEESETDITVSVLEVVDVTRGVADVVATVFVMEGATVMERLLGG